jgi:hypothetical protein
MRKLALIGLFIVSGCASWRAREGASQEKVVLYSTPGAPKPEGKMICATERPTGSNIAQRVCRYQNQSDWAAERTQDALLDMQRRPCTGKGVCTGQ